MDEFIGNYKLRSNELTGRARVRSGLFGTIILQVEVRTMVYSACPSPPGYDPGAWRMKKKNEGTVQLSWRDARWDDLYTGIVLELVQPNQTPDIRR